MHVSLFCFYGIHFSYFLHEKFSNSCVIYISSCLITQFEEIREVVEVKIESDFGVSRSYTTLYVWPQMGHLL
jgi:hypothetical protein